MLQMLQSENQRVTFILYINHILISIVTNVTYFLGFSKGKYKCFQCGAVYSAKESFVYKVRNICNK